jgi:DNA-binding NarL/FixJ family response regulator
VNVLRLVLVDDHQVVRLGLRTLLEGEPDITVVGEAGTAAAALEVVGRVQPDIVLMDIRLPDQSGIAACQLVRQRWPTVQVLMLTSFADEELVLEAIGAGAAGYVLKQVGTDDLLRAVRAVGRGDAVLDPTVTRQLLARARRQRDRAND